MSADLVGAKRRWAASAAGAIVVMVAVLLLLRVPRLPSTVVVPVSRVPAKANAAVEVARPGAGNKTLDDEAVMRDQKPLFLPTEKNVRFREPKRPEAGRSLLDRDDQRYSFGAAELKLHLPAPQVVAEAPAEVMLTDAAPTPLYGFGRGNREVTPFPARGALLEILATGTSRRVLAEALPPEAKPPTERAWRPLEFIAHVDAAGLVGPLVITERSDVEEVDKFFQNYLVQRFRIGERLPPGFYRILVGP